jgi:signal transduction histidine kinase
MKSYRLWWVVFLVCTVLVLAALAWITSAMLRMERSELEAREMATHQESLRLALWRMDSWLAPRVAREAARPYTDYQPLAPQFTAYNKMLEPIEAGEILTASPLLPFQSEYFRLHFQIDQTGNVTSPQAPSAAQLERLPAAMLPTERWIANDAAVQKLGNTVEVKELESCVAAVEDTMEQGASPMQTATLSEGDHAVTTRSGAPVQTADAAPPPQRSQPLDAGQRQTAGKGSQSARNAQEWDKRREAFAQNVQDAGQSLQQQTLFMDDHTGAAVDVGPLVPIWFSADEDAESELMFVRRVRVNGSDVYQGFLCNWPRLRDALLGEIDDLFPEASLAPTRALMNGGGDSGERAATRLATLPASLNVPPPVCAAAAGVTPGRVTAAIAWIVVLAGVGLTGSTLRSSIAFGRKRAQFASAVTHELRTPLTTFKMYTDMLAEDMVSDEAQKREYMRTLQGESDRLARLVENVLSYARLEDGRQTPNGRTLTITALLGRVTPQLERRASASGLSLVTTCDVHNAAAIHTDDDAVGQILLNLVDNACKYRGRTGDGEIHLHADVTNGSLALTVRDDGPGIPASEARHLFQAFRRGSTSESSQPGLGIGLTLSRALARRMGGDLRLLNGTTGGASFELTIPLGVSAS